MLMLSIGMSLTLRVLWSNWREMTASLWMRLFGATFLFPPLLALGLGHLFELSPAALAGFFLVGVAPGAPLMTRGVAKKGFDMEVAASYQVWGALLIPLVIPVLLAGGGWLYGRELWIAPTRLLAVIAKQVLLPLIGGMLIAHFWPQFCAKVQRGLNLGGNALLSLAIVGALIKLGPALGQVNPLMALSALLLAVGCLLSMRLSLNKPTAMVQTLSICNVNRHVGLALLLSHESVHDQRPLPAIAAYAIAATVVMIAYSRLARRWL